MASPTFLSFHELWAKHEQQVFEVFTLALQMLRDEVDLPTGEDPISEVLALKARQINFSLNQKGRGLQFPPDWEKPQQPRSNEELGQSKKKKRPDFSCPFRNHTAQNHEDAYLDYHIECKRFGKPTSKNWELNKNYVNKGILRFVDHEHGYGKGTKSGAMLGYVQDMNLKSILWEVNNCIQTNTQLPLLNFPQGDFDNRRIAHALQKLKRTHVSPTSFELKHIWVDLRR